ncbi:MAG: L-threonylcarbamoyladenylate synthase [Alphaproteobacteria bacterium]|nr:L-threonylcarbamoyladenylate synthase [Alphaproteobacteria bacterium]
MSNIYDVSEANLNLAAETLKSGGLVAFPTETVYGLGANVYLSDAVAKIFAAKERPKFDPLISHIADIDFLPEYALTDERIMALGKKFWPGPLTIVMRRKDNNPAIDLACSGLENIAVRMPAHPVALELIRKSGVPVVAPSANRFKSISPTTAHHVRDSLGDKVDMILDGGQCSVGVESTIIDLTGKQAVMLRAGGTTLEALEDFLNEKVLISHGNPNLPSAPGQLLKHYAPGKPLRINATERKDGEFYIGFGKISDSDINLSPNADLEEAASRLFAYLRFADRQENYSGICMSPIPETGLGLAINDRIRRAAYKE